MDRRKYLKTLAVSTVGVASAAALMEACKTEEKKPEAASTPTIDRTPDELKNDSQLQANKFFDAHEMATIAVLADIIIPKDDKSGSATDAKVPDFIEFIVKDMPQHQTPMRGGLKWLDLQCSKTYANAFVDCSAAQQIELIDQIAYPEKAKPEMQQGVSFFNLMRDLTATGFFTSKMGIEDLGYVGNRPNQWNGVPQDVLDQYGLKYDQKTLDECVKFDS
ncbi:MAG: gluconate 2-dehydrogenase subunit 3 family protein [Bacteroidetes bacterium]|nr:gluconate 2-dehydrogenase subunit 3 family protein [Bacteroidota bacterium]MBS1539299.1 gluconate 2-dehydrogenase subunit 3 family protein [Bacteroidota bacterium]